MPEDTIQEIVTSISRWLMREEQDTVLQSLWQINTIIDGEIVGQVEEWRDVPFIKQEDI